MVIVDISVPRFFKKYDFKLRDDVPIGEIINQVCDILKNKEQCAIEEEGHEFLLCSITEKQILQKNQTLRNYNIRSGNRLLLV